LTYLVFVVTCVACGKKRCALRASDGRREVLRLPTGWWQSVVNDPASFAQVVCNDCMRVEDEIESQRIAIDSKLADQAAAMS